MGCTVGYTVGYSSRKGTGIISTTPFDAIDLVVEVFMAVAEVRHPCLGTAGQAFDSGPGCACTGEQHMDRRVRAIHG